MNYVLTLAVFIGFCRIASAQSDLYDLNTIQKIEIKFAQNNWDYLLDTTKMGTGGYTLCEYVKINGIQFDSAGVKFKGSSSYDSSYVKNPFNISLDEFKSQTYNGIKTLKLANCYADPSMVREVLGYNLLKNYMDCPKSNFAQIYVNGRYIGLYSNDESVNKKFCSTYFNSSINTFIKCSPLVTGPHSRSSLNYITADSSDYFGMYELESDYGWTDLVHLCDSVSNNPESMSSVMDMDRLAWMLAFNSLIVNLDSYSGWFSQNYYLYKDLTGRFNPIVWDLNMSFGGFPFAGTQGGSAGSLTVADMKTLSPSYHSTDTDWPLIKNMFGNTYDKLIFFAHLRTMLNEQFVSGAYETLATQLQSIADTAVLADTNKFFSYSHFVNGLTTDYTVGSFVIPGIKNLMQARSAYLLTTAELSAAPPVISNVSVSNSNPLLNQSITVQANITNIQEVYLNYRFSDYAVFNKVAMFDDGMHGDGAANDHVFGASFQMTGLMAGYYITALNAGAAMLSPERAEHEFYSVEAHVLNAQPGDITINEILAKNENDTTNEAGSHEDWFELFNNTQEEIDLFGLYLTDDYAEPTKFAIEEGTVIPAGGSILVWADEESSTEQFVHCNFKLSASGEALMLSDGAGTVIDSVTFGVQAVDVSYGRCPNGTGPFVFQTATSFNAGNLCGDGIETPEGSGLKVYPNPVTDQLFLSLISSKAALIELSGIAGNVVYHHERNSDQMTVPMHSLSNGLYFLILKDSGSGIIGRTKIIKAN